MILVCAADDFQKNLENLENNQFLKIHKKICHKQNVKCLVFFKSTRQVCNHLYLNSIKAALKTLIFFKKLIFAFLNPKNREVIENFPKHRLTLVNYNAHTWAKIHFNTTRAYSDKKKLKSGYLELRFSVQYRNIMCWLKWKFLQRLCEQRMMW